MCVARLYCPQHIFMRVCDALQKAATKRTPLALAREAVEALRQPAAVAYPPHCLVEALEAVEVLRAAAEHAGSGCTIS